jgi:hypothetical protein
MDVKLGQTVKDKLTGFQGLATGFCSYITGCSQVLVQPKMKKGGDFVEPRRIDRDRLTVEKAAIVRLTLSDEGPDLPAPIR